MTISLNQAQKLQDKAMQAGGFVEQLLEAVYNIAGADMYEMNSLIHINAVLSVLKASEWSVEEVAFNTVYSRVVLIQLCEKIERRALLAEVNPRAVLREVCGCATCAFLRRHPDVIEATRANMSEEQKANAAAIVLRGMLDNILEVKGDNKL